MNKTIDTETLLLKVESHEHRIGIMENLLRDAKQVLTLEEAVPTARLYTLKSQSF